MYVVVLMLGLLAMAGGLATAGFGFSIKEFSLGSTLMIAGTMAFVGGLVMVAIAGAIRELRRIAQALAARPAAAPRIPRPGEAFDPYAPGAFRPGMAPARAPAPMPPPPYERPARDERPREAPLAAAAVAPMPEAAAEPTPVVEEPEAIPLSPDETPRGPAFEPPDLGAERMEEREAAASPAADETMPSESSDPVSEAIVPEHEPPEAAAERQRRRPFETIWPAREQPADSQDESGDAAGSLEPSEGSTEAPVESREEAEGEDRPEPPPPVSILKSGVVDGMAYTLYSDGSIEAELSSGTIRFASISELRMHLEKTD